jgi:DNA repair exonuclease SbcCD nuclease subunit
MKIHMISDTHFGIYQNNLDKWLNMMEETFYNFVIPYLKENVKEGDILIHLEIYLIIEQVYLLLFK